MSITEMSGTARAFREIQSTIKELEAEAEALKQKMIDEMDARQVEELAAGEYTIRWIAYASSRVDTTALRADMPDIAERFTKKSVACRFTVA